MTVAALAAVGALIGVHVATWGAYKDLPYEGFRLASYVRSVALATATAIAVAALPADRGRPHALLVVVGVVYAVERLATESWKAILREDPQDRYTIPMRLAVRGRPVRSRGRRYAAGGLLAAALVAGCWAVDAAGHRFPGTPPWLVMSGIGSLGGWVAAAGGAWKDAPIEGFSGWKFLRSPSVAAAWAAPLSLLTADWLTLAVAAAGLAAASIETYKTFLTGGRAPGKFAGRPVRHRRPGLRRLLALTYCTLWVLFAVALAATPIGAVHGLTAAGLQATDPELPAFLLGATAFLSVGLAGAVVGASRGPAS